MCRHRLLLASVLIWACQGTSAFAGPCDAYYRFDGNLVDASGSGHDGMMIGPAGVPNTPRFVDGRVGRALVFDGTSAMRAFVDLAYDRCPQVTVTAWIRAELHPQQVILGSSHGLFLMSSMSDIALRVGGDDLWARRAVFPDAGWMFVAGTWDTETRTASVFWRERSAEGPIGSSRMETEPAIWLGALNDNLEFAARNLVVDELRVIGRSLDHAQIMALQNSGSADIPATVATATTSVTLPPGPAAVPDGVAAVVSDAAAATQSVPAGVRARAAIACSAPGTCAAGSYCALDQTCHPDRHRPIPQSELATAPISIQPTLTQPTELNESAQTDAVWSVDGLLGPSPSYLFCTDNGDCGAGREQCYDITTLEDRTSGSMCTRTCATDAECESANGFPGACYSLAGSTSVCYQRCDAQEDCYVGSVCISVTLPGGSSSGICVPDG